MRFQPREGRYVHKGTRLETSGDRDYTPSRSRSLPLPIFLSPVFVSVPASASNLLQPFLGRKAALVRAFSRRGGGKNKRTPTWWVASCHQTVQNKSAGAFPFDTTLRAGEGLRGNMHLRIESGCIARFTGPCSPGFRDSARPGAAANGPVLKAGKQACVLMIEICPNN